MRTAGAEAACSPRVRRRTEPLSFQVAAGAAGFWALGSVFAGLQLLGWRELMAQGVLFSGKASGTFVYLISALHVVHVLGGMLYLLALLLRVLHADRDAVRALVYIRNPFHRRQLRLLSTYWHFVDGLWVALFAVFLFLY